MSHRNHDISKTLNDEDPVDVLKLAKKLKGVAHILVQQSKSTNQQIRTVCEGKNEYNGAIGIYYPNQSVKHRKYLYQSSEGIDKILFQKVIRSVIQYSNSQMVDTLYTWQGVNNALLRDRLESQKSERAIAERERRNALHELLDLKNSLKEERESVLAEANKILDEFQEDTKKDKEEVDKIFDEFAEEITRLSKLVDKLEYEKQGLQAKLAKLVDEDKIPVLFMGERKEFFQGEIKDILLYTLKKEMESMDSKNYKRRYDVLKDIINANHYEAIREQYIKKAKSSGLRNFSKMDSKMQRDLNELGFKVEKKKKHYEVSYYGDPNYVVIYANTPSDTQSAGENNLSHLINIAFR